MLPSDVTRRLLAYWFEENHEVAGFPVPFRYHFWQRWEYARVNQSAFEAHKPHTLVDATQMSS